MRRLLIEIHFANYLVFEGEIRRFYLIGIEPYQNPQQVKNKSGYLGRPQHGDAPQPLWRRGGSRLSGARDFRKIGARFVLD